MTQGRGTDLGQALAGILGRLDRKSGGALTQLKVMQAWGKVAGDRVLEHTTGAHLRKGELVVYVDSPVWATELSALSEQYKDAVKAEIGEVSVTSVRFSVSKRVAEKTRAEAAESEERDGKDEEVTEPVALTDAERAQVEASAAVIDDERLRQAVVRATVADLEWKKGIAEAKRRHAPREGS